MPRGLKVAQTADISRMWQEGTFLDHMPDAIVLVGKDGRIAEANRQCLAAFGYQKGELLGQPVEILMPERFRHGHLLQHTAFSANPRALMMSEGREICGLRKDGDEFHIEVMLSPLPSAAGGLICVVVRDISERRGVEEAEQQVRETLSAIINASQVAIVCLDPDRRVTMWGHSAQRIFGYTPNETMGKPYPLVPPNGYAEHVTMFRRILAGETLRNLDVKRRRKDGALLDIRFASTPLYDRNRNVRGVVIALEDVTERIKAGETLKRLAYYDPLTGLRNRHSLELELKEFLHDDTGAPDRPVAIAVFDLDGLGSVNDALGHLIGDRVLREAARRLAKGAGTAARAYRFGGNKLVVALPACGDPRAIVAIVDSVLTRLAGPFTIDDHVFHIAASAGIAIAPGHGCSAEDLIASANLALREAEAAGPGTCRLFTPALRAAAAARRELDGELRRAHADSEFELHFQPQLRAGDGAVVGAEALLRWRHPQRGLVSPAAFIDTLAQSPVARAVGTWILRAACTQAAALRSRGLPDLRMGVNLFPAQFHSGELVADVESILRQTGLPARCLELEITENIVLGNDETMLPPLLALRDMGVSIALDDFGTGYASLSSLTRFPLSRIKIDRSFVGRLPGSEKDAAIVRSLVAMAREMGLEVVAEGIETPDQLAFLRAEQCYEVQGYLFARPLPAAQFETFVGARQTEPSLRQIA